MSEKCFKILTDFNRLVVEKLSDVFSGEIINDCLIFDLSDDSVQSFDLLLKTITEIITSWRTDGSLVSIEDDAMEIHKVLSMDVLLGVDIIKVTLIDFDF